MYFIKSARSRSHKGTFYEHLMFQQYAVTWWWNEARHDSTKDVDKKGRDIDTQDEIRAMSPLRFSSVYLPKESATGVTTNLTAPAGIAGCRRVLVAGFGKRAFKCIRGYTAFYFCYTKMLRLLYVVWVCRLGEERGDCANFENSKERQGAVHFSYCCS